MPISLQQLIDTLTFFLSTALLKEPNENSFTSCQMCLVRMIIQSTSFELIYKTIAIMLFWIVLNRNRWKQKHSNYSEYTGRIKTAQTSIFLVISHKGFGFKWNDKKSFFIIVKRATNALLFYFYFFDKQTRRFAHGRDKVEIHLSVM